LQKFPKFPKFPFNDYQNNKNYKKHKAAKLKMATQLEIAFFNHFLGALTLVKNYEIEKEKTHS
jgi:hypothetical protein